jgi:DNA-binding beta-propeller fold protein YncE
MERSIRFDQANRELASSLIGQAIVATQYPPTPEETKFYVADTSGDRTFEYGADGGFVTAYDLHSGNTMPRGAAADATGETVWVLDNDDYVYVYDHAGTSLGRWKARGLSQPEGIATNGQDVWIVDRGNDEVHFFANAAGRRSGSISAATRLELAAENSNPRGITTDGTSLWTVDSGVVDRVYKYALTGELLGDWVIDPRNDSPRGITIDPIDPDNLWIVDNATAAIYQYLSGGGRTSGSQAADAVFALDGANSNPQGIADPPAGSQSAVQADVISVLASHARIADLSAQHNAQTTHSDLGHDWPVSERKGQDRQDDINASSDIRRLSTRCTTVVEGEPSPRGTLSPAFALGTANDWTDETDGAGL